MSVAVRPAAVAATLAVLALALVACGSSDESATGATPPAKLSQSLPAGLGASVEAETDAFLARQGTALRQGLRPYLGPRPATAVEPGSAICRPAAATASIADPERYPFACVVRGSARSQGLEVEVTLGFVGTELDGECWRAANERVSATTTTPALLSRAEAMRPVNQIAGCAVPEAG